jgi:hypothetical protein
MSTLASSDPTSRVALRTCLEALRMIAEYQLDPALDQRMLSLGERKESLNAEEHAELMALVRFTQQRTIEKLRAELALQRLLGSFPDLSDQP